MILPAAARLGAMLALVLAACSGRPAGTDLGPPDPTLGKIGAYGDCAAKGLTFYADGVGCTRECTAPADCPADAVCAQAWGICLRRCASQADCLSTAHTCACGVCGPAGLTKCAASDGGSP